MNACCFRPPDQKDEAPPVARQGFDNAGATGKGLAENDITRWNALRARWRSYAERICWRWKRFCGWAMETPT